jgi:Zn-dependent membrane protease YugP
MPFFYYDPTYLLYVALPLLVLSMAVQFLLKATYSKYSQVESQRGITGAEAAQRVLALGGIQDVRVEEVGGFLSDHYDPREKVLRLSPTNFSGRSIAAIGVSAHEAGHALQHAQHYAPLVIRNLAVPVANIGSTLGYIVIFIGIAMGFKGLAVVGLILVCGILFFQLVNLPVEFDASRRALEILPQSGILTDEETVGARKVLAAAALTYVAAMVATLWTILYYAMRLGLLGGRRDD